MLINTQRVRNVVLFSSSRTEQLADVVLGNVFVQGFFEREVWWVDAFHAGEACIEEFFAVADPACYQPCVVR